MELGSCNKQVRYLVSKGDGVLQQEHSLSATVDNSNMEYKDAPDVPGVRDRVMYKCRGERRNGMEKWDWSSTDVVALCTVLLALALARQS